MPGQQRDNNKKAATGSHVQRGLSGRWRKDKARCDSMEEMFEALKLPWLYRKAASYLDWIEIKDTEEHFRVVTKAGGILDVVEQYPWSGEAVVHKRRDKRAGPLTGRVVRTAEGPELRASWQDPFAGEGVETFTLGDDDVLTQTSVMRLRAGGTYAYRTVYLRERS